MTTQEQKEMDQFEDALQQFYHDLFTSQQPLPPVFERIMYDNLWELCEQ